LKNRGGGCGSFSGGTGGRTSSTLISPWLVQECLENGLSMRTPTSSSSAASSIAFCSFSALRCCQGSR